MANVKVSVIIPAFNAATFIGQAIDSVMTENKVSTEIIVVDDASTDNTREVINTICETLPNVRLITSPLNQGPSAARNRGIDNALGDWIAILDADDAFTPGRINALVSLGEQQGADIVADNVAFYDVHSKRIVDKAFKENEFATPFQITLKNFIANNVGGGRTPDWGLLKPLIRKNFLNQNSLRYRNDIRHGEDFHLIVDALLNGAKYLCDPSHYYRYSTRESGRSRTRIDYKTMWLESEELTRASEIANQPELCGLLRRRVEGLKLLDAKYKAYVHLENKKYFSVFKIAIQFPLLFKTLPTEILKRKVKQIIKYNGSAIAD